MSQSPDLDELMAAFNATEPEGYVTTDLSNDLIDSLKLIKISLGMWESDPSFAIKWSVIAAHAAANTALIDYLSGSLNVGALTERLIDRHQEALEEGHPLPVDNRVAHFNELLERALELSKRAEGILTATAGQTALTITNETRDGLSILNALRGRFIHRRASGWMIEQDYALRGIHAGIVLVAAIDDAIAFWDNPKARDQIQSLLQDCKAISTKLLSESDDAD